MTGWTVKDDNTLEKTEIQTLTRQQIKDAILEITASKDLAVAEVSQPYDDQLTELNDLLNLLPGVTP